MAFSSDYFKKLKGYPFFKFKKRTAIASTKYSPDPIYFLRTEYNLPQKA
jgi:hypothetical protein